ANGEPLSAASQMPAPAAQLPAAAPSCPMPAGNGQGQAPDGPMQAPRSQSAGPGGQMPKHGTPSLPAPGWIAGGELCGRGSAHLWEGGTPTLPFAELFVR